MARKARVKSTTGIYHVLIRAIADVTMFNDNEDCEQYLRLFRDLESRGLCKVYAYAFLPTHQHLLIAEGEEDIGAIMRRVGSAYSYFFNVKYEHYGPIYQDRFKSNPVETRTYYLKVLDHIMSQDTQQKSCLNIIPQYLAQSASKSDGSRIEEPKELLDFKPRIKRITDTNLLTFLKQTFGFTNIGEFLQRTNEEQTQIIRHCKLQGGSVRQIARITGCPFAYVFNAR